MDNGGNERFQALVTIMCIRLLCYKSAYLVGVRATCTSGAQCDAVHGRPMTLAGVTSNVANSRADIITWMYSRKENLQHATMNPAQTSRPLRHWTMNSNKRKHVPDS